MRTKYIVAAYHVDRAYGGPEEGGWYFDCGELLRVVCVSASAEQAYAIARRANRLIQHLERELPDVGSVISEGRTAYEVHENTAPEIYPSRKPHYE